MNQLSCVDCRMMTNAAVKFGPRVLKLAGQGEEIPEQTHRKTGKEKKKARGARQDKGVIYNRASRETMAQ